jgi:hypothetical protein
VIFITAPTLWPILALSMLVTLKGLPHFHEMPWSFCFFILQLAEESVYEAITILPFSPYKITVPATGLSAMQWLTQ